MRLYVAAYTWVASHLPDEVASEFARGQLELAAGGVTFLFWGPNIFEFSPAPIAGKFNLLIHPGAEEIDLSKIIGGAQ